jgi:hypothetical protein
MDSPLCLVTCDVKSTPPDGSRRHGRPLGQEQLTARGRAMQRVLARWKRSRLTLAEFAARGCASASPARPAEPDQAYGQWITTTGRGVTDRRSKGTRTGPRGC